MNRLSHLLFLSIILLVVPLVASAGRKGVVVGGWKPIKDVKGPHVVEIGKYAVEEHNKQAKDSLKFVNVVTGYQQVVAGINYRLVVATTDSKGGIPRNYEAVVWEKEWEHFRNLSSFKLLVKG